MPLYKIAAVGLVLFWSIKEIKPALAQKPLMILSLRGAVHLYSRPRVRCVADTGTDSEDSCRVLTNKVGQQKSYPPAPERPLWQAPKKKGEGTVIF